MAAVRKGSIEVVALLLEEGARTELINTVGRGRGRACLRATTTERGQSKKTPERVCASTVEGGCLHQPRHTSKWKVESKLGGLVRNSSCLSPFSPPTSLLIMNVTPAACRLQATGSGPLLLAAVFANMDLVALLLGRRAMADIQWGGPHVRAGGGGRERAGGGMRGAGDGGREAGGSGWCL